ncbi:hypothetical protein MMC19_000314 [Ptychographa xylographoides]|nr:hypothetical protein [Ptychographa xylographoides]
MPSTPFSPSLPEVDISPFLGCSPDPSTLTSTATALSTACLEHGFFYLTNHDIPPALTARVLALARTFFTESTDAEKQVIKRQDAGVGFGDGARGYQVVGDNVTEGRRDWHEAIDWYRPIVTGEGYTGNEVAYHVNQPRGLVKADVAIFGMSPQNKIHSQSQSHGSNEETREERRGPPYTMLKGINLWPSRPAEFRAVYEIYVEKMLELGTAVVRAMGHALDLDDPEFFVQNTRESFWVMRAIGYPPLPRKKHAVVDGKATVTNGHGHKVEVEVEVENDNDHDETEGISCGAHTDYGCLTLLLADPTPGALQVQSRTDPSTWIAADPIEGAFVVNIGDMMERWTNGLWKSTRHRVVHRGEGFRVSVPFFFEPDFEAKVRPLSECVKRTGGRMVWEESVGYGEHLLGKVGGNFYGSGDK